MAAVLGECEIEYKNTAAVLQAEVNRRDALLEGLQKTANDLQGEVNRRDEMLVALQARLDRTLDARLRRLLRKLLRR